MITVYGRPGCAIPPLPRFRAHTRQPVLIDLWRDGVAPMAEVTTVANWRGYGSVEHGGVHYGQKAHSLRRVIDLPRLTRLKFLLLMPRCWVRGSRRPPGAK